MTPKPDSLPESFPSAGEKGKVGGWGKPLHLAHMALGSQPSQGFPSHLEWRPYHGQQGPAGLGPSPLHIPYVAPTSLLFLEYLLSWGIRCSCFLEHLTPDGLLPHSLISLPTLLKCHLLREAFPGHCV